MVRSTRLGRSFFERDPDDVARELIGTTMMVRGAERTVAARIVECEAYGGSDDPASHAYRGLTPRTRVMFGPAGHLYVYRIYGLHWCMNIVTGQVGDASAVLLRAAEATDQRSEASIPIVLRGPGNLTKGLGVTGADDGVDCCAGDGQRFSLWRPLPSDHELSVGVSTRIGVTSAIERQSRYFLRSSDAVSRHPGMSARQRAQHET